MKVEPLGVGIDGFHEKGFQNVGLLRNIEGLFPAGLQMVIGQLE